MHSNICFGLTLLILATAIAEPEIPPLRQLAAERGLKVGTAVKPAPLREDQVYRETLLRHFEIVTPENELKLRRLRPERDVWQFADADHIVDFAVKNGLEVRGHTLCWNGDQHSPDWLLAQPTEPDAARALLRDHIVTVMHRYRGRIRDWDVVNEAIGNDNRPGASPYVPGHWLRSLGESYIGLAFRLAREADPKARLFYNDYDHGQALAPKSDRIYGLLKRLKAEGVPVDGVGLQLHCSIAQPPVKADLVANFQRLAELGLIVQVTELDVEIMTVPGPVEERLKKQAAIYRDVFEAAIEANIDAVVMWGFTDRFRQQALLARKKLPADMETPLWLFDGGYRPKPAFFSVVAALSRTRPVGK